MEISNFIALFKWVVKASRLIFWVLSINNFFGILWTPS